MLRFTLLIVGLLGAIHCSAIPEDQNEVFEIKDDIPDLRADAEAPLTRVRRDLDRDGVLYTVGARQNGKY